MSNMKIDLPIVPNFVVVRDANGQEKECIPLGKLTDSQLLAITDAWRDELIFKAHLSRRKGTKTAGVDLIEINI